MTKGTPPPQVSSSIPDLTPRTQPWVTLGAPVTEPAHIRWKEAAAGINILQTACPHSSKAHSFLFLASLYPQLHWLTKKFATSSDLGYLPRHSFQDVPWGPTDHVVQVRSPVAGADGASQLPCFWTCQPDFPSSTCRSLPQVFGCQKPLCPCVQQVKAPGEIYSPSGIGFSQ